MSEIKRFQVGERMSHAVVHGDTVYTAVKLLNQRRCLGGRPDPCHLSQIDDLLREAGTDKSRLISATIWLSDISTFNEMNEIWDAWVVQGQTPCRACVESKLAAPQFTVEISVIAAL